MYEEYISIKPTIIKKTVEYSNPWLTVIAKTLNNEEEPYYSLELRDYVTILAKTEKGEILLVRQYRPAIEEYNIELPAGLAEPDEAPLETAIREIHEETGYKVRTIELLGRMVPDSGRLCNIMYCYYADVEKVEENNSYKKTEDIDVLLCSEDALRQLINNGSFNHALHLAVLCLAATKNKI
jgi:ADP-ribose pyrophosphatase